MRDRGSSIVAWALLGLAVLLVAGTIVLLVLNRATINGDVVFGYGIGMPSALAFAAVGGLIAARHPRNAVGWLFCGIALSGAAFSFTNEYGVRAYVTSPGSLPLRLIAAWLNGWVLLPVIVLATFVFLLFPSGRLLSRRWRPVAWALVTAGSVLVPFMILKARFIGGRIGDLGVRLENPTGIVDWFFPVPILSVSLLLSGFAAVVSLILRYRRAVGEERQQLRWFAYMAILLAVDMPLTFLGPGWYVLPFLMPILAFGFPIASGVAILKYRLYDLDIVIKKTVVIGVLVAFITLVYAAVVIAIPTLVLGAGSGTSIGVSALYFGGAVFVALAFLPVRNAARRLADRLVYGSRATPYEVLSDFSERLADAYSTEDVLPRMVQILAAGTGATDAQVWLKVGQEFRPAASWPEKGGPAPTSVWVEDAELPPFPGRPEAWPVRHQGELLGAITLVKPASDPLTPSQAKLLNDLAAQTGLVLRNVRLIEDLRASRRRIVTAQDERAKTLERNIHDGAQQQLVALSVKLRLLDALVEREPAKARALVSELQADSADSLENLRDLARGIYPPLLADKGLPAALQAQARKSPVPVEIESDGVGRYPQEVEAAVYFCCLEALQNVAKYADASRALVRLTSQDEQLAFSVEDDGAGFDPGSTAPRGSGFQNMIDRLEALGGALDVVSAPGAGTTVVGRVPATVREER